MTRKDWWCPMILRDAFTAIQKQHWAAYDRGKYRCGACDWTGTEYAGHALHVASSSGGKC